ncbi:hypothetical protein E3N88_38344 [Mikania micrantha]|uniref:Peptidase M1 leukotriene A4 hydrolase/aminopeptidase C-terminal domain-containing protein n=1 Tax=Mikania micrantha TaxID=192012 RepID=A0A5N6LTT7_9ASTR|nr:hypothetical protein E3N88_38344 [Mikania micrantha]
MMQVIALDCRYRLSKSRDYEVKVAFLQLAIGSRCSEYYNVVEKTLKEVGRMKYLRPLYTALVQGNAGKEEEKIFAQRVFAEARETYHPIAQGSGGKGFKDLINLVKPEPSFAQAQN